MPSRPATPPEPDTPRWRQLLWFTLRVIIVVYMIYAGLLALVQRKLIFPGTDLSPAEPTAKIEAAGAEQWWLQTEQGKVEAFYLPAEGVSADEPGPAVIIAHGNGELIDGWLTGTPDRYREAGISVLLPEYRGYGRSAGSPSQEHITRDYVRFYDRLAARPEVDAERIFYHGFSLGGGVVGSLTRKRPPKALILQSTFTRIADMAQGIPVPDFLIRDPFDTLEVVRTLDVPMLVVHGTRDPVVPFEHGQRLAEAARDAEFVKHAGGHHLMADTTGFWRAVHRLLEHASILNP